MVTEEDLEKKAEELVLSAGPKGHKRFKSHALKLIFAMVSVFVLSGIAYGTYQYFFEPRGKYQRKPLKLSSWIDVKTGIGHETKTSRIMGIDPVLNALK